MPDPLTFTASLPPIDSAINLHGAGDGARIKLDIPRTDTDAILLLQRWYSGVSFRITIEPFAPLLNKSDQDHDVRQRKLRKSQWAAPE